MLGWLTKDSIPERITVCISLPNSEAWQADFRGCILQLTKSENWEEYGALSSLEMADEWRAIFFAFLSGECSMIPVGSVIRYAGTQTIPTGFLLCNGQAVSRSTYASLFAEVGTSFGNGNGTTTFNLPDCRGRVGVGLGDDNEFMDMGQEGGAISHTLTTAQLPAHAHPTLAQFRSGSVVGNAALHELGDSTSSAATGPNTSVAGGGQAHNNMQPYLVFNYIIKY